jgi:hypothetical protein
MLRRALYARALAACLDSADFTYSNGCVHVLGEHNPLGLNNEEVDELLNIVQQALERGLGDGEVLARPELGGQTPTKGKLPSDFRRGSNTECQVESLEDVADDVEVSGSEDEDDGSGE